MRRNKLHIKKSCKQFCLQDFFITNLFLSFAIHNFFQNRCEFIHGHCTQITITAVTGRHGVVFHISCRPQRPCKALFPAVLHESSYRFFHCGNRSPHVRAHCLKLSGLLSAVIGSTIGNGQEANLLGSHPGGQCACILFRSSMPKYAHSSPWRYGG